MSNIQRVIEEYAFNDIQKLVKEKVKSPDFQEKLKAEVVKGLLECDLTEMVQEILYDDESLYQLLEKSIRSQVRAISKKI
jgi:hypothetical protein